MNVPLFKAFEAHFKICCKHIGQNQPWILMTKNLTTYSTDIGEKTEQMDINIFLGSTDGPFPFVYLVSVYIDIQ